MFQGLRAVIYGVTDIERAKKWYGEALGTVPLSAEPFHVGFNVGGYKLGLDPNAEPVSTGTAGAVAFWGVENIEAEFERLLALGAKDRGAVKEVGGGIQAATVLDPFGNILGLILNPHFRMAAGGQRLCPPRQRSRSYPAGPCPRPSCGGRGERAGCPVASTLDWRQDRLLPGRELRQPYPTVRAGSSRPGVSARRGRADASSRIRLSSMRCRARSVRRALTINAWSISWPIVS